MSSRVYDVIRALLFVAVIAYLVWQIVEGRSAIASLKWRWDAFGFVGALIAAIAAYQCLLLAWLMLLRQTGLYAAEYLGVYSRIWWVSYLYRYVPGKVLLLVERARMGKAVGIPPAAGAALTIIETLLAILAGSAVSLLAVAYYADIDKRVVSVVTFVAVGTVFLFPAAYRWFCRLPVVAEKYPDLESVALSSRQVLIVVIPYVLHYLLLGTSFFLLSQSLDLFSWQALPGLCGIYALSHVVSLMTLIAPGGLGVREGALAVQLGRELPTGVAEAFAIGVRIWFTAIELLCYFSVVMLCPRLPAANAAEELRQEE